MWFGDPKFCIVSSKSPNSNIWKFDGAVVTRSDLGFELLDTPSYIYPCQCLKTRHLKNTILQPFLRALFWIILSRCKVFFVITEVYSSHKNTWGWYDTLLGLLGGCIVMYHVVTIIIHSRAGGHFLNAVFEWYASAEIFGKHFN